MSTIWTVALIALALVLLVAVCAAIFGGQLDDDDESSDWFYEPRRDEL